MYSFYGSHTDVNLKQELLLFAYNKSALDTRRVD